MGYISLYNYDNNFELEDVPFCKGGYQATIAIEAGTFSYAGVTFTKTISTSGSQKVLTIRGNGYFSESGVNTAHGLLEAAGLGHIDGMERCNIIDWAERPSNNRYGGSSDSIAYPMFRCAISLISGTKYSYSIYAGRSSSEGLTRSVTTPPATIDEYSVLSFLALDTRTELEYGGYVLGYVVYDSQYYRTSGDGLTLITVFWDTAINPNTLNGVAWNPDAGQKGFRPIGDKTAPNKPRGGGSRSNKNPDYITGIVPLPGAPDESAASAVGSGFVNVYKVPSAELSKVGQILFDPNFDEILGKLFLNPADCLISLNIFPCSPDVGSLQYIKGFGFDMNKPSAQRSAQGYKLSKQFKTFDFGSVTIPEQWESFLDYDATSITLFLPFIGEVDLPADEVMGGTVSVVYTVDFVTGMCVANVSCGKVIALDNKTISHKAIHSYQGNCAMNMPLTAVNYGAMIGSFVNAANSGLRSGIAGAVGSLATDMAGGGFRPTVTTRGTLSANAGFCGVLYPYIVVTRPIPAEPEKYQEVLGYPSYINNTIGSLEGLCVCEDIDLSGIAGATDSELARIKQLCREGVRN
jgi:hypothetical protein